MAREEAHTAATVTAISEGMRVARLTLVRSGVADTDTSPLLRSFRQMQAEALRADWARRARQSIENVGRINARLERELRELNSEYPETA